MNRHSRSRLALRIASGGLTLLLALGLLIGLVLQAFEAQARDESLQRLNTGLARYVERQVEGPIIDEAGRVVGNRLDRLRADLRSLNPAIDLYVLDRQGRLLAQSVDPALLRRDRVNLLPVQSLLDRRIRQPAYPLYGDDPRQASGRVVFSASGLEQGGVMTGYLYLVLGERAADAGTASVATDTRRRTLVAIAAGFTILSLCFAWWLHRLLRPLAALTRTVAGFRERVGDDKAADDSRSPGVGSSEGDEVRMLAWAIKSMQRRIEEQFVALETLEQDRRAMIAQLAHDFKTPLARIEAHVDTLDGYACDVATDGFTEHLAAIRRQVRLTSRRVADLFTLSDLQAAGMPCHPEAFSVAELASDLLQDLALDPRAQGASLRLEADRTRDWTIHADIGLVERALGNLLDNAVQACASKGMIAVRIGDEGLHGKSVRIEVVDNGRGFAPHEHPNGPGAGRGLGLPIVRSIVRLHRGTLRVASTPGKGACVTLVLPVAGADG